MRSAILIFVISTLVSTVTSAVAEYDRDKWKHWIDADEDCEDTRSEVLQRDSMTAVGFRKNGCDVENGSWHLPYTGEKTSLASDVDIDHVIPLKWAYLNGGDDWSLSKKQQFANDPENLLATQDNANQSKGQRGPEGWVPKLNQCQYAVHWRYLLDKYDLDVPDETASALDTLCQF